MMYERYPLVICYSLLLNMAIEIVDLPIEHGDFPLLCKSLPEGMLPPFSESRGSFHL